MRDPHSALPLLLTRYFAAIDDDVLDTDLLRAVFTDDCRVLRPNGDAVVGVDALLESQTRSFARFAGTQHRLTDHLVTVHNDSGGTGADVDRARLRANLVAMHLWAPDHLPPTSLEAYFVAGSVVRAQARRTSAGWRVAEVAVTPTWRSGSGISAMVATR